MTAAQMIDPEVPPLLAPRPVADLDGVRRFIAATEGRLGPQVWIVQPRLVGLPLEIVYENGELRGALAALPTRLAGGPTPPPRRLTLRGDLVADRAARPRPHVVVSDVLAAERDRCATASGWFYRLRSWGLPLCPLRVRVKRGADVAAACEQVLARRGELPFAIDGVVVALDALAARRALGATARHARWAVACTMPTS